MKDCPHILNFGLHSGFEDFKEPEEDYILALGDCSMENSAVDEVFKKLNLKYFKFRIGGGAGWEFDYEKKKSLTNDESIIVKIYNLKKK